jgi:hypothetical protein
MAEAGNPKPEVMLTTAEAAAVAQGLWSLENERVYSLEEACDFARAKGAEWEKTRNNRPA